MSDGPRGNTAFFTCGGSRRQVRCARLLLDSIRAFGGELRNCPFWVVEGDPKGEVPDAFWGGVFAAVGEPPDSFTVESFIEGERIRPYFNSAAFSVRPVLGLMRTWLRFFETLVTDDAFQEEACGDERHRVFLHQAAAAA